MTKQSAKGKVEIRVYTQGELMGMDIRLAGKYIPTQGGMLAPLSLPGAPHITHVAGGVIALTAAEAQELRAEIESAEAIINARPDVQRRRLVAEVDGALAELKGAEEDDYQRDMGFGVEIKKWESILDQRKEALASFDREHPEVLAEQHKLAIQSAWN